MTRTRTGFLEEKKSTRVRYIVVLILLLLLLLSKTGQRSDHDVCDHIPKKMMRGEGRDRDDFRLYLLDEFFVFWVLHGTHGIYTIHTNINDRILYHAPAILKK